MPPIPFLEDPFKYYPSTGEYDRKTTGQDRDTQFISENEFNFVRKYPDVARIVPDSNDTKMNTEW
jgi:hypothetical protein